jgi:hypothetical protein
MKHVIASALAAGASLALEGSASCEGAAMTPGNDGMTVVVVIDKIASTATATARDAGIPPPLPPLPPPPKGRPVAEALRLLLMRLIVLC